MFSLFCFKTTIISILFILVTNLHLTKSDKYTPTKHVEVTAFDEKLRDPEGFLSIKIIHATLDDDKSGSIERSESNDFLVEDFKFGETDRAKREKAFHNNDDSITLDDLWETWFQSNEREWSQKHMVEWLINKVKLPQYANNFMNAKVTGKHLPRMAVQNSTFLLNIGIKNYIHRQKIQLKALDLVLFGSQDTSSPLKDVALAALLILLVTLLVVFKTHNTRSKKQMAELSSMLSKLRDMETDFEDVQHKLEGEGCKSVVGSENTGLCEMYDTRHISELNGLDMLPFALQPLLRRSYEIESTYLDNQKMDCLNEMHEAKELVDKMRRKQMSIVNSLKLATGAISGTDGIDNKIFSLKTRMEKIKMSIEECIQRWSEIESMCGFSITGPFEANNTQTTSSLLRHASSAFLKTNNIFTNNPFFNYLSSEMFVNDFPQHYFYLEADTSINDQIYSSSSSDAEII